MTGGTDMPSGYSLLQNCDVFLAIRPNDDSNITKPPASVPNKLFRQSSNNSGDSSDDGSHGTKSKIIFDYPNEILTLITGNLLFTNVKLPFAQNVRSLAQENKLLI